MVNKRQTLPRHTVLASQGSRTGAFLIDALLSLVLTLVLLFGVFSFVFEPVISPMQNEYNNEQIYSGLKHLENDNPTMIASEASYDEYKNRLTYYYMNYLTGESVKEGYKASRYSNELINEISKKDFYTVSWFNKNVLEIPNDPDNSENSLFTYQKDNLNNYDLTKIGIPKDETSQEVNTFLQKAYLVALSDFASQDYIADLVNEIDLIYSVEFVLSSLISISIFYILFPYIFKNGVTLGKKAFGLGLANKEGYKLNTYQLFMRSMPIDVILLAMLLPVWSNLFVVLLVYLIIFLVSFALAMASPKKASLHDFAAGTIVINLKETMLFDSESEEEQFIFKEDGVIEEEEMDL